MTTNATSNVPTIKDGENTKHEPVKRALFIGIVYKGVKRAANASGSGPLKLRGPHEDCNKLSEIIQKHYGYKKENITMLLDTKQNMKCKKLRPTRKNIIREIKNLVQGARPGDCFFFHYSGHGDQVPCGPDDQEPDGMDETLVPYDAKMKGDNYDPDTLILDNLMHELMVKPLPEGARLTAIYDMCHAGTALDLKHYDCNRAGHPLWRKSLKTNFETPGLAKLSKAQSTCIPDLTESKASEDKPASSPVRGPGNPIRRKSHFSERSICMQPNSRNIQQEMSRTSYVEGHADRGVEHLEIRTRSMSLNLEDPVKPTETSTKTSKTMTITNPSSPTHRQARICRSCSLPLEPGQGRSNSIAQSIASTMQHGAMLDGVAFILPHPSSSQPKKDKGVLAYLRNAKLTWPPRFCKRRAKTVDTPMHVGHDVIKGPLSPKVGSEGTYVPRPLSKKGTMTAIQEYGVAEVESPTSISLLSEDLRLASASPEPTVCNCPSKGGSNDAGYPDVISIASCSDGQSTYENPDGLSVTQESSMYIVAHGSLSLTLGLAQTLIGILEKNPHPTYKVLMKEMSASLYEQAMEMLRFYKLRKKYRESHKKEVTFTDVDAKYMEDIIQSAQNQDEDAMEEFVVSTTPIQEPTLGSQKRLNLNDKFSP